MQIVTGLTITHTPPLGRSAIFIYKAPEKDAYDQVMQTIELLVTPPQKTKKEQQEARLKNSILAVYEDAARLVLETLLEGESFESDNIVTTLGDKILGGQVVDLILGFFFSREANCEDLNITTYQPNLFQYILLKHMIFSGIPSGLYHITPRR